MKRLLTLVSVVTLLALTVAPANAASSRRPVRAHPASAYNCISPADTGHAMYYVHAGGGPGGGNTYEAWGSMNCGAGSPNYNLELEVCMGQLLSGGWSIINSSCQVNGPFTGAAASIPSHWVGLTKGRWYAPWIYEYASGQYTYGFWPENGVRG